MLILLLIHPNIFTFYDNGIHCINLATSSDISLKNNFQSSQNL